MVFVIPLPRCAGRAASLSAWMKRTGAVMRLSRMASSSLWFTSLVRYQLTVVPLAIYSVMFEILGLTWTPNASSRELFAIIIKFLRFPAISTLKTKNKGRSQKRRKTDLFTEQLRWLHLEHFVQEYSQACVKGNFSLFSTTAVQCAEELFDIIFCADNWFQVAAF